MRKFLALGATKQGAMTNCGRFPLLVVGAVLSLGLCGAAPADRGGLPALRILVGYTPAGLLSADSLEARLRLTRAGAIPQLDVHVMVADVGGAQAALAALRADPGVRYAELDGVVRALRVPNDTFWP